MTEEELCKEFGVSRVPVREALHMLDKHQLVERAPHRGCTVKQPSLVEINELYDVRVALESFVVERLATQGMAPLLYAQLQAPWREIGSLDVARRENPLTLAQQDEAFHEGLARATGNHILQEQLRMVDERLHFVRVTDITTSERLRITCQQHLHILECIRQHAAAAAVTAIRENIEFGRANVETALKDALARAYMGVAK